MDDQTRELVDWERTHISIGFAGGYVLSVSGTTPIPMQVRLEPMISIPEPEWWQIEVVGYYRASGGSDVEPPFTARLGYDSLPPGCKGIELIGATRREKLPPEEEPASASAAGAQPHDCREWSAWHDRTPGRPATLHVHGVCTYECDGYDVRLGESDEPTVGTTLALTLSAVRPEFCPARMTDYSVAYARVTDATYTHVEISPLGVSLEVQETSLGEEG